MIAGNHTDKESGAVAAEHQRLIHLLDRLAETRGHMVGRQILRIHLIAHQLIFYLLAIQYPGRIRLLILHCFSYLF